MFRARRDRCHSQTAKSRGIKTGDRDGFETASGGSPIKLQGHQLDTLQELINIGVGQAASVLNEMIDSPIQLQVPFLEILSPSDVRDVLEQQLGRVQVSTVQVSFTGSFSGTAQLIFPIDSAAKLVAVLTSEDIDLPDLNAVKIGTLSEVGNIVINGVIGEISNLLNQSLRYSLPNYFEDQVVNLLAPTDLINNTTVLLAQAHFTSDRLQITGDLILIFKVGSFDALLSALEIYQDYFEESAAPTPS